VGSAWHLVTGEYPPEAGGVGEYSALLARALAGRGRPVHVWTPAGGGSGAGVEVHAVGRFHGRELRRLDAALERTPAPRTLLVQYAPQAFGVRGMNVAFCRWVLRRARRGDEVRVMFHEPFVQWSARHPRRNVLAAATHGMAWLLLRASRVAYVSTPAWERLLRPLAGRARGAMPWLPIPSTVPRVVDAAGVADVRRRLGGGSVVGHFGTYGGHVAPLLERALLATLPASAAMALLLGAGGPEFAARLERAHPTLRGRLVAPGRQEPGALSIHLQACDVALQPYPDGVTARRTTAMAALANGVALVSTDGTFTEPPWRDAGVFLADGPVAMAATALRLLGDPSLRRRAAADGLALYEREFSMARTLRVLEGR
jgi:glycosyltransferase involved in cell wall biosynthesis